MVLNLRSLELTFNPVNPRLISENDLNTYIDGIRELISLDAVLVTASANIDVSPRLKFPPTSNND